MDEKSFNFSPRKARDKNTRKKRRYTHFNRYNDTKAAVHFYHKDGEYDIDDIVFSLTKGELGILVVYKDLVEMIEASKMQIDKFKELDKLSDDPSKTVRNGAGRPRGRRSMIDQSKPFNTIKKFDENAGEEEDTES